MQQDSLKPATQPAVKQAASGDAKASVVSRRVPMPVGIKTDKTGGKK